MRYVGRPPGTQSQHLEPPLLVGCCRGPEPRPGSTRAGRSSPPVKARPELPAHVQVQIPRQRFGTFTQSLSGASTQRSAGRDGRAKRARTANRRYAGLNLNRVVKRRPASSANVLSYWGSTRSPEDFKRKATVRSSVFVTRPPALVMGASSSGLRTPDLLPESEPAGPRDLSSTASPRRDATRGSRSRPASRPESEETRPACRWSNPSRPRPALHVTRRREQGGGARAHVTVPEPKFF